MEHRNFWKIALTAAAAAGVIAGPLEETACADSATTIVNEGSGMCLEVLPPWSDPTNFGVNGLWIVQAPCNGSAEQLWDMRYQRSGWVHIVNRRSGQCLDVTDGNTSNWTHLQQWTCNGTSSTMAWSLDWGANIRSSLSYYKCVDIRSGSHDIGAVAQIYDCSGNGNAAQLFSFTHP